MRLLLLVFCSGCTWIPIGQHFADLREHRSPVDPLTGCRYVLDELDLNPSEADEFSPIWAGFRWGMYEDEAGLHDYARAENAFPALFIVDLYGPEADRLCGVYYDIEELDRAPDSALPEDGSIVAAWEIERGAPASTDCPALDPEVFGTEDVLGLLGGSWAFGVGELGAAQELVADELDGVPRSEWKDWALGAYVTYDGQPVQVMGYDISYEAECGESAQELAWQPQDLDEPLRPAIHVSEPLYVNSFTDYTGLGCWQTDVYLPGDWTPGGEIMDVAQASVLLDLVPSPDGGLSDFMWDADDDGTLDPQASTVTISLYDDDGEFVCFLAFDAALAVEIDPDELDSEAELWRAWEMPLQDPTSDCARLDPLDYGTDDPMEILSSWSFGFALGELDDLEDELMEAYPEREEDVPTDGFGVYVTLDGVVAEEVGAGFGYDLDDCYVRDPDNGTHPASLIRAGLVSHWYTSAFVGFDLEFQ